MYSITDMETYTLYKQPIQLETLAIVRYLHAMGVDARPAAIIERMHPAWVTELPAIETARGERFVSLRACCEYYERVAGIDEGRILQGALDFARERDDDVYRISDIKAPPDKRAKRRRSELS